MTPKKVPHAVVLALLASGMTGIVATAARAQDAANGRYVMSPTAEGFLKLDTRSGEVSECRRQASGFQCTLVADERSALQAEIDRLARENASLKDALAANGVTPPPSVSPRAPATTPATPSDREFDRAIDMMERFVRRFMAIVREDPARPQQP